VLVGQDEIQPPPVFEMKDQGFSDKVHASTPTGVRESHVPAGVTESARFVHIRPRAVIQHGRLHDDAVPGATNLASIVFSEYVPSADQNFVRFVPFERHGRSDLCRQRLQPALDQAAS
jgi:hypothetical protein